MSFSFRDLFNGRQQEDDDSSSELSFLETRSEESNDFFVESTDEAKIVSPFELVEESETPKASIHNEDIFDGTVQEFRYSKMRHMILNWSMIFFG